MTATFLLPFAIGACQSVGGDIVRDAFGIIAMVAMTPLIAIQILGAVYKVRLSRSKAAQEMPVLLAEQGGGGQPAFVSYLESFGEWRYHE